MRPVMPQTVAPGWYAQRCGRSRPVPARPAQKGVPNPFKPGELMDRPAKPAYSKVKVRALKLLKDMAK